MILRYDSLQTNYRDSKNISHCQWFRKGRQGLNRWSEDFLTDENILFDTVILTVRHHSFKSIELCNRRSKPYCMHIL